MGGSNLQKYKVMRYSDMVDATVTNANINVVDSPMRQ